jgi:HEPN domain-containing protein
MGPAQQERLFEPKYASELMRIAWGDYKTAEVLSQARDYRIENAYYMVQQSIENALKAALVHRGIAIPLIHDLGALLGKIPADMMLPYGYELNELNQYAAVRRYEEGPWSPSQEELRTSLAKNKEILEWAGRILAAK